MGDVFVSKLDSAGNFVWARQLGGTQCRSVGGMALDAGGNVYTMGGFSGTADFDPAPGTFNLTSGRLAPTRSSRSSTARATSSGPGGSGGTSTDYAEGMAVDAGGNVHTVGCFRGTADFDPGPGTFNLTSATAGFDDVFVSKLDSAGNFVWAGGSAGLGNGLRLRRGRGCRRQRLHPGNFQGTADFDPGPARSI